MRIYFHFFLSSAGFIILRLCHCIRARILSFNRTDRARARAKINSATLSYFFFLFFCHTYRTTINVSMTLKTHTSCFLYSFLRRTPRRRSQSLKSPRRNLFHCTRRTAQTRQSQINANGILINIYICITNLLRIRGRGRFRYSYVLWVIARSKNFATSR